MEIDRKAKGAKLKEELCNKNQGINIFIIYKLVGESEYMNKCIIIIS